MRYLKILILLITALIICGCSTKESNITITFVTNGGETLESIQAKKNTDIDLPTPIRYGYKFLYWKDVDDITYTGKASFKKDVTLYAHWDKAKFTVKFVDFDGKLIEEISVNYLDKANPTKIPSRTGYSFIGWDKDFSKVTENMTVTAQYEVCTEGLQFELYYDYYIVSGYIGSEVNVVIPSMYNGIKVIEIKKDAFRSTNIETIKIPNTIEYIGDNAFTECIQLKEINIPSSVQKIGKEAFFNCSVLHDAVISAKEIGEAAFYNCNRLANITLTDDVEIIQSHAFYAITDLITLYIPSSVNSIGDHFISWCKNFTTLKTDSNNVTKLQGIIDNLTLIYINAFNRQVTSSN